jgi:hypothetical protein
MDGWMDGRQTTDDPGNPSIQPQSYPSSHRSECTFCFPTQVASIYGLLSLCCTSSPHPRIARSKCSQSSAAAVFPPAARALGDTLDVPHFPVLRKRPHKHTHGGTASASVNPCDIHPRVKPRDEKPPPTSHNAALNGSPAYAFASKDESIPRRLP